MNNQTVTFTDLARCGPAPASATGRPHGPVIAIHDTIFGFDESLPGVGTL